MARFRSRVERDPVSVVRCEQRFLVGTTVVAFLALIIWLVAVGTDYWFHVDFPGGVYINKTGVFFLKSHSGLWRICKTEIKNGSREIRLVTTCQNHALFPTEAEIKQDPETDRTILDYTRTETAFSIISVCLMCMGLGFSGYTFKEPRYMFKRLAGGVHLMTAATVLVVIEVLVNSVTYEEQYLTARHPKGAVWTYGFSFGLAWFVFVLFVAIGCIFMICSRKRKGEKAASEHRAREDEPHILGRI